VAQAKSDEIPEGDDLAAAIAKLKPEEAEFFLAKLEAVMLKRKMQLTGYLVSLVLWVVTMFLALAYYGTHDGFVGWVFLIPFGLVGLTLFLFGKWADKISKAVQPRDAIPPPAKPTAASK
jgi:hypothetical protein